MRTEKGKNPRLLASLGEPAVIDSYYKPDEWNELHIIAMGNTMTHILNGHILSVLIDEDPTYLREVRQSSGSRSRRRASCSREISG